MPMGNPARTIQLGRPLDFAAVTDHSEGFGTQSVCFLPGLPGYDSLACQQLRQASAIADPALVQQVFLQLLFPVVIAEPGSLSAAAGPHRGPTALAPVALLARGPGCRRGVLRSLGGVHVHVLRRLRVDRNPGNANLHRNVIFRNADVPGLPVSYIEQRRHRGCGRRSRRSARMRSGDVIGSRSRTTRTSAGRPDDVLARERRREPLTAADAATRAAMEPLVEIYQHKGSSECRPGVDSTDEQCGFELVRRTHALSAGPQSTNTSARLGFVRNALKEGLVQEQRIGVNPFRLGIIASTDTHNGSPGHVREDDYTGHVGRERRHAGAGSSPRAAPRCRSTTGRAGSPACGPRKIRATRIFAAMRRRETYGTSGPRHLVRFFAGNYSKGMCGDPEYAKTGYRDGAAMGAEIGPVSAKSPVFAVLAMKDPGDGPLRARRSSASRS